MPYSTILVLIKDHAKGHIPDILSPGVFSTEQKAVQSLFKLMIEKCVLSPMCDDCENYYRDCECDEEKNVETWRDELIDEIKTKDDLDSICDDNGDSYYGQNWFFRVFKQSIDHEQVKFGHI